MAPSQFIFKNSEILGKHSLGIDSAFATMGYPPTHNLGVLVQASYFHYTTLKKFILLYTESSQGSIFFLSHRWVVLNVEEQNKIIQDMPGAALQTPLLLIN